MVTKKQNKKMLKVIEGEHEYDIGIIEAEEGDFGKIYPFNDFQEYCFLDGTKVPSETPIGIEIENPRTKKTELHLFEDIRFN